MEIVSALGLCRQVSTGKTGRGIPSGSSGGRQGQSWQGLGWVGVLITEGLECCAQECGPHCVNSREPVEAFKQRSDRIQSNSSDPLWSTPCDPGILLNTAPH